MTYDIGDQFFQHNFDTVDCPLVYLERAKIGEQRQAAVFKSGHRLWQRKREAWHCLLGVARRHGAGSGPDLGERIRFVREDRNNV